MLKHSYLTIIITSVVLLFSTNINAQSEISSPYSAFGMGTLTNTYNGSLAAMGNVSYAMQDHLYINVKNPASYVAFDSLSFIADAALSISFNTLTTNTKRQRSDVARFQYLMIGMPITKHWRTSAGFVPFSDIGYNIINAKQDVTYSYSGNGGLMQLYWGNAFNLFKGFSLGFNASYIFGKMDNVRFIDFSNSLDSNYLNSRIAHQTAIDGIYISAGLQYFTVINNKHKLGFGFVYENSIYIWAKENLLISNYLGEFNPTYTYDTVRYENNNRGRMIIPQSIGGGISYFFDNKFLFGADVTWQNWNKYRLFDRQDSLKNSINISAGIQYIPNYLDKKFYKRMKYRIGARYSTGYMIFHNTPVTEFGVTAGVGLPFRSFTSQSSLNIMFEFGQMGTIQQDLIKQTYFKLNFSFILHEKWYQRVKLE